MRKQGFRSKNIKKQEGIIKGEKMPDNNVSAKSYFEDKLEKKKSQLAWKMYKKSYFDLKEENKIGVSVLAHILVFKDIKLGKENKDEFEDHKELEGGK